jgi:hypothetical protein
VAVVAITLSVVGCGAGGLVLSGGGYLGALGKVKVGRAGCVGDGLSRRWRCKIGASGSESESALSGVRWLKLGSGSGGSQL